MSAWTPGRGLVRLWSYRHISRSTTPSQDWEKSKRRDVLPNHRKRSTLQQIDIPIRRTHQRNPSSNITKPTDALYQHPLAQPSTDPPSQTRSVYPRLSEALLLRNVTQRRGWRWCFWGGLRSVGCSCCECSSWGLWWLIG